MAVTVASLSESAAVAVPQRYRIAVIGGDGIGPEVIEQAIRAAEAAVRHQGGAALEWNRLPWSTAYYKKHGYMLPPDGWDLLRQHDAILFGAVGDPSVPDRVTVHELLLPMRRRFDQYVNLRPAYLFAGVSCPLVGKKPGDIDILVFRENTEGEYAPVGGRLYPETDQEVAVQTALFTRRGCERIMRAAFEAARRRPRKKVTSITKSNALVWGMGLWDAVFEQVRREYPDVASHSLLVDAAAMDLVRKPESFDVIVASNLFGDILTDLSAAVTGSIGLASSANLNPTRQYPSMFEPVHGSAPDIAGKGIANPLAAILSAGLMLDHLGLTAAATAIRQAVARVLAAGKVKTPDLGGSNTTTEMGDAVVRELES
ncbi:MAG: tartrate dehydrogenase [Gemmataceae bacterium]|nr:tartrate dehydrogenase [Gemmataceae bacterium]MCS7270807.1 tartrate dehydrogenase [Gemmataceae bacterium]MDW8244344.1 tartrate dehydrogenase [Thermogemmata sp.]